MLKFTGMNAQKIRQKYLDFYKRRNHQVIDRAKLIPDNDPTTLFTGSGMQPLLPYLLGKEHPKGTRLTDSQTCMRAQDIEDVGDNRHTTFFEMLGNWSLGDYTKKQQIEWFFEFLTDEVGLDPHKLYVSAFVGDKDHNIPRDDEAVKIWQQVFKSKGIDAKVAEIGSQEDGNTRGIKDGEHIFFYNDHENWWSRNGGILTTPIGDPCGPDSEVFYDFGEQNHDKSFGLAHPASDSGRFLEIGNQVFMQYRRMPDGSFKPLDKQNIDFGGGLERIEAASLDNSDIFKTSLLWPIVEKLEHISGKNYDNHTESMRVIADHLRSATFLAVDGVIPSNKEQGYVMRRLIRRAIRFAFDLGVEQNFLSEVVPVIADIYNFDYPEVGRNIYSVIEVLIKEEKTFRQTLSKGLRVLNKFSANGLTGTELFMLYDTYGFPVELSTEEAFRQNIELSSNWRQEFDKKMSEQRLRSQTAAKGTFKGGLSSDSEMNIKYHTAAHLLLAALQMVLDEDVQQKGCNITDERLRLDFSHDQKLTTEQIKKVEDIVNEQIKKDLKVSCSEHTLDEAINKLKAHGQFSDRYGDTVKVYKMALDNEKPFSLEVCGGPHVGHTSELADGNKKFKIIKEESSSAGVRRIKAQLI